VRGGLRVELAHGDFTITGLREIMSEKRLFVVELKIV
jgi:hypothetical protein